MWDLKQQDKGLMKYFKVTHVTILYIAHEEGLLSNYSNMHLGSRSMLFDKYYDLENDGFNDSRSSIGERKSN